MINLHDLLHAGNGQLFGDAHAEIFNDFCFDSRRIEPGQLFIALKTERGDGHQFMQEAVKGGATGLVCTRPPEFDTEGLTVVVMRDVESALLSWTKVVLQRYGTTVIGVTGSTGKSTTKEAIAKVLGVRHTIYKNPASFNGRLGLPLALGKLGPDHRLAVLEFGTDRFGEMAQLVEATRPTVGVITNISHKHIGRLGTLENIAHQNGVLIQSLPPEGVAILNEDDEQVRAMRSMTKARIYTYGLDPAGTAFGADMIAYNIVTARDKTGFDIRHSRDRYRGRWVNLLGIHQLYCVMAALSVGLHFDVSIEDGLRALTELSPLPGRLSPLEGLNGSFLLDDSYNATPESTVAALDFLHAVRRKLPHERTIFVLGDMDDLGTYAVRGHLDVGKRVAETADVLITIGELAATASRAAVDYGMSREQVRVTFSHQDAVGLLREMAQPTDVILVKGGTNARLERVTAALLANEADRMALPRQESAYERVEAQRPIRPTWIEIDKTVIAENVRILKGHVGADCALMAVVKANAFGHGAIAVATTALLNGANYLGVATVSEAIELRDAGIDAPILVLGYTPPWAIQQAIRYRLAVTLYDLELARMFDRSAADMNATLITHIKIDSGMGRLGLLPDQVIPFFRSLRNLPHLQAEGVFTHFSAAESDPDYTFEQLRIFLELVTAVKVGGFDLKYIHAANSAATLSYPEAHLNMVRPGMAIYGLSPGVDLLPGMRPALTWKTTIAQVKRLPPGSYVGYSNAYQTKGQETIAVIPVGYGDGFRRAPHTWGEVLVQGQRAPLVGRVSMDQSMINVTHIPGVTIGDEVVLIGKQGEAQLTTAEVAQKLKTTSYEVVSTILSRVPRI
jgi:alanine racemase